MGEVSNKTIVALLTVALVITVVGTVVSVSKLSGLGGRYTTLTGLATDTGTTSITVAGTAAIQVTDASIDFGSGYYNVSCTTGYAWLASNAEGTNCWLNTSGQVPEPIDDPHELENNGTTSISITADISNFNASDFICGGNGCPGTSTSNVAIRMIDTSAGCTVTEQTTYTTLADDNSVTQVTLCGSLSPQDNQDDIEVNFNLTVPQDVDQGAKTATITYTGTGI
ncbi:MAG: hypothetical protein ABH824_03005 [Nanoarchaeota archaeon]|nr:hypothetical protein [Nanoarchaeota archaeon]MBU1631740.1 hypothetical protein [Nanoarchaeota archaeon]MBU1875544.1 hypothetical protein [Nanoarchaeota archaeon]